MSYCQQCGMQSQPGDSVCRRCGTPIVPLPPPGAYPPPGPPPGAYPPMGSYPIGAPGYPASIGSLADWGTRAKGILIDIALELVVALPLYVLGFATHFFVVLAYLGVAAVSIYLSIQVGQTGQSPGMRVAGIKCISQTTGRPIGGGLGVVRGIAHFIDNIICYVGWLFPLWDAKRQTLADKIMGTVVITVPPAKFSVAPPA